MTGFEYTAAIGMLYENMTDDGLRCIQNIRYRYDGVKRSPFDEAECGHHYARAMISWASTLALSGFQYSGVDKTLHFNDQPGAAFSTSATATRKDGTKQKQDTQLKTTLTVLHGQLPVQTVQIGNKKVHELAGNGVLKVGEKVEF